MVVGEPHCSTHPKYVRPYVETTDARRTQFGQTDRQMPRAGHGHGGPASTIAWWIEMPRPVAIAALFLMLLTGLVLGQMHTLGTVETPISTDSNTPGTALALQFYEAANTLLATGDATELSAVLHGDFTDHRALTSQARSTDDLIRYFESVREVFPGVHLEATSLQAVGRLVVAEVTLARDLTGSLAGIPFQVRSPSNGFELLRIADDKIVERWDNQPLPLIETAQLTPPIQSGPGWRSVPVVERHSFEPRGIDEGNSQNGTIFIVESGSLNLSTGGDPPVILEMQADFDRAGEPTQAVAVKGSVSLAPGSIAIVPGETRYRAWNSESSNASVLQLTFETLYSSSFDAMVQDDREEMPTGVQTTTFAEGEHYLPFSNNPFELQVAHAILTPGTSVAAHVVNESETLIVVRGSIEVSTIDGVALQSTDRSLPQTISGNSVIDARNGVNATQDAQIGYDVAGNEPAEVWLVNVISPGDD